MIVECVIVCGITLFVGVSFGKYILIWFLDVTVQCHVLAMYLYVLFCSVLCIYNMSCCAVSMCEAR